MRKIRAVSWSFTQIFIVVSTSYDKCESVSHKYFQFQGPRWFPLSDWKANAEMSEKKLWLLEKIKIPPFSPFTLLSKSRKYRTIDVPSHLTHKTFGIVLLFLFHPIGDNWQRFSSILPFSFVLLLIMPYGIT